MTIVVEDGTGIYNSETYASVAAADAYWLLRTQDAKEAIWTAATTPHKEGSLREATAYIESIWGKFYLGDRKGNVQALLWPRSSAFGANGYPILDLPTELVTATIELAARAVSARLALDVAAVTATSQVVKKAKGGPVEVEFLDTTSIQSKEAVYGFVLDLLDPILNGLQSNNPSWNWK